MDSKRKRLNTLIGQLHAIGFMIDENEDCAHVLIQLKAASSALKALTNISEYQGNTDKALYFTKLLRKLENQNYVYRYQKNKQFLIP